MVVMDPNAVFDLSSDEEVGWVGEDLGFGGGIGDDCNWIQELLNEVDKDTGDSDESDDVVLVREVLVNPKPKLKKVLDEDDDDCVVLDGDPDKPVAVENNNSPEGESDELLVVGETGKVACRDYPHPRHLCVKFPFTSTPHETHCNQCHCYVCDSLAPCLHWGAGISSIDHCHATEKEDFWQIQRKSFKNGNQATIPVPKVPSTSLPTGPAHIYIQSPVSTPVEPNYVPQVQVPMQASIRPCSRATTNFGTPNIPTQSRTQQSAHFVPSNRSRPNSVLQHLRTASSAISRDRRHTVGNLGPHVNSESPFKRTALPGVTLPPIRRGDSLYKKYGPQYASNRVSTPGDNNNLMRWQNTYHRLPTQSNVHINCSNSMPSQPQLSSQTNITRCVLKSVPPQTLVTPQPSIGNMFVNPVTNQQPQVHSQPYISGMYLGNVPTQPQVSSQPFIGNDLANTTPSDSQLYYSQPTPASNDYQNVFQQESQSFLDPSLADIDSSYINPTSQNGQQLPAGNSQLQGGGLINEFSSLGDGIDSLFSGPSDPNGSLEFQYENWNLDNHDVQVPSPEPGILDPGYFLGF